MSIVRLALELLALYFLYKFIFDFIIPLARTTKQVKKQFSEMSAHMQQNMRQQQGSYNKAEPVTKGQNTGKSDDYIEFEEVKK